MTGAVVTLTSPSWRLTSPSRRCSTSHSEVFDGDRRCGDVERERRRLTEQLDVRHGHGRSEDRSLDGHAEQDFIHAERVGDRQAHHVPAQRRVAVTEGQGHGRRLAISRSRIKVEVDHHESTSALGKTRSTRLNQGHESRFIVIASRSRLVSRSRARTGTIKVTNQVEVSYHQSTSALGKTMTTPLNQGHESTFTITMPRSLLVSRSRIRVKVTGED